MRPAVISPVRVASLIVGEVPNTRAPEPVSPVTAAARFALLGVPRKVATLAPRPATPVLIGRPVASARLKAGVASAAPRATETPPKDTLLLSRAALGMSVREAPEPEKVVALRVPPENVREPLSSSSPAVPARTTRPEVRSETLAELATKPPATSAPPSTSRAPVTSKVLLTVAAPVTARVEPLKVRLPLS